MQVEKKNGKIVDFDKTKIYNAIVKAMSETTQGIDENLSNDIANKVEKYFIRKNVFLINTDNIHDVTEDFLMESSRKDVAKKYILFRDNRGSKNKNKNEYKLLDDEFISEYKHRPSNMPTLGEFVFYRTYSRYLPDEKRREYWWETCRRAVEYNCSLVPTTKQEAQKLFDNMFNLKQFLSGRTIWVGGTQVSKTHVMSNFNCAFETIEDIESFTDLFYLLMLGSGVGVRVLKEDIKKIPKIRTNVNIVNASYEPVEKRAEHTSLRFEDSVAYIIVGDSKTGWVDSLRFYLEILTKNHYKDINTIIFNYNSVRPNGEKLKTFGGTASGHEALKDIFNKISKIINRNSFQEYYKLKPIDCLDICNIIGECVVVGGVRRTAEIVLFDSDDEECITAKQNLYKQVEGQWIVNDEIFHRSMSNNSIYYKEKPTRERLHWQVNQMRYSGEPAFVNEEAGKKRRVDLKGVNPCAEILLDSKGTCNLTTVNVMAFVENGVLNKEELFEAQRLSARAGYRMTCPEFELPKWNTVQQRDRLLGCSLTGWQDMVNAIHLDKEGQKELLKELRDTAKTAANKYAESLGFNKPLLTTTIKPEGTLSQLPVVSSGIHYSHSPYYIRRIRVNANDPIIKVCEELGFDVKPENGQDWDNCKTKVVSFPVKAPEGITKYDVYAIEQLENYIMFMDNYIDHNCSITVHVREHEWEEVEQWLWDNWDNVVAVSFLALDDSFYEQLPYEAITEEVYNDMLSKQPNFISSLIAKYEKHEQEIEIANDPSCSSGVCPIR